MLELVALRRPIALALHPAGGLPNLREPAGRGSMDQLSLRDPLFATYATAATIMILKVVGMSWLTVVRMMQVRAGFRSPEDLKKTVLNPAPDPRQLQPNEAVDRIRRIQMNDIENVPFFLAAGFLYILTRPPLLLAEWLLYGYVISRLLHFAAYYTGQIHEVRATLWTIGSVILIFMSVRTLLAALG
jgi:glutathione S-transferase